MNRVELLLLGKGYPSTLMIADDTVAEKLYATLENAVGAETGAISFEIEGTKTVIECKQVVGASLTPSAVYNEQVKQAEARAQAERKQYAGAGLAGTAVNACRRNGSVFGS